MYSYTSVRFHRIVDSSNYEYEAFTLRALLWEICVSTMLSLRTAMIFDPLYDYVSVYCLLSSSLWPSLTLVLVIPPFTSHVHFDIEEFKNRCSLFPKSSYAPLLHTRPPRHLPHFKSPHPSSQSSPLKPATLHHHPHNVCKQQDGIRFPPCFRPRREL